jgi:hypothetical protein
VLSAIGEGKLDNQVIVSSADETGQMLGALDAISANENYRHVQALPLWSGQP